LPSNFNADPAGSHLDLLNFDGDSLDLGMVEHKSSNALGQCLEQRNVTLRRN